MAKKDRSKSSAAELVTKATPDTAIVRANVNRKTITAPSFTSLYANDVQVQTTPWDIRLIFGEITDVGSPDEPNVTVRQLGEVRLSLPLAKRLAMIVVDQLKNLEQVLGQEIPIPKD
jgi:hypothetical protein